MSQVLINQYLAQLDVLKRVGGTHRESVVREAFKDLLKGRAMLPSGSGPAARAAGQSPKCAMKSEPEAGRIVVDRETVLSGIPRAAWDYRLGNRSALDWVLDQHKEKKPKDPTIREKFDTYRFKDHKEGVIDLLARVTTVSVETVRIVDEMKGARR